MPIAFVISTLEESVVNAVQPDPDKFPRVDGSLFKFNVAEIPRFLTQVRNWAFSHDRTSEEFRAAMRLQERLGSYVGQKLVEAHRAGETPSPALQKVAGEVGKPGTPGTPGQVGQVGEVGEVAQPRPKRTMDFMSRDGTEANRTKH